MKMSKGKTLKLLRCFKGVEKNALNPEDTKWEENNSTLIPGHTVANYAKVLGMRTSTVNWFLIASDPENTTKGLGRIVAYVCLKWLYFLDKIGKVSEE